MTLAACGSDSGSNSKTTGNAKGDDSSDDDSSDDDDDSSSSSRDAGKDAGKDAGTKKDSGTSSTSTGTDAGKKDSGTSSTSTDEDAGHADAGGSSNTSGDGGSSGDKDSGGGSTSGPEPEAAAGCDGAKLYKVDETNPETMGPWPVGVKTLMLKVPDGTLVTEVWYPAKRGSESGKTKEAYDLRDWLPMGAGMVPDSQNKLAQCECYRDLPIDSDHGPYPVVLFIHGLGSFRVASLSAMQLWASRGFIVIAADHPGSMLTDYLGTLGIGCSSNPTAGGGMDTQAAGELADLNNKSSGFDFLGDSADLTRLALAGHSMGGGTVAGMGDTPNLKVAMLLAPLGYGTQLTQPIDSMLYVTGIDDSVVGYSTGAFDGSQAKIKRSIGITGAGHIDVTDLCKEKNDQGETAIQVASDNMICVTGAAALEVLAQCGTDPEATDEAPDIVNYSTTATLEETLHCQNRDAAFNAMQSKFPKIGEYKHQP